MSTTPPGQGPDKAEDGDEKKVRDGGTNGNGGSSIADQAAAADPPVPEVSPTPLGSKQPPIPGLAGGRKKPPVKTRIIITAAAADARGQVDVEGEQLLIVRARYFKATTTPKFDGEGRVQSFDYDQTFKPTWTEGLDDFLAANGLKMVRVDEEGDAVDPTDLVNVEELRREREKEGALD
jgi:hypothetical protein